MSFSFPEPRAAATVARASSMTPAAPTHHLCTGEAIERGVPHRLRGLHEPPQIAESARNARGLGLGRLVLEADPAGVVPTAQHLDQPRIVNAGLGAVGA